MQVHGQVVTDDGARIGVVKETGTATITQPDMVTRDVATGAELSREAQPNVEAQSVTVVWEDGSSSTLVETVDQWVVLGSVRKFPRHDDDPVAAAGETDELKAATIDACADIGAFAAEWRATPAAVPASATVTTEVGPDPAQSHTVVLHDGVGAAAETTVAQA